MRNSEAQPIAHELPIKMEYTGNYSAFLHLDTKLLEELIQIMGVPKAILVIRNGKETIERTGIVPHSLRGPFMDDSKQITDSKNMFRIVAEENQGKKQLALEINSQVLDGCIRDLPDDVLSINEGYEKIFIKKINAIIQYGIETWALYKTHEKSFSKISENRRKNELIRKFLAEHRNRILFINKEKPKKED